MIKLLYWAFVATDLAALCIFAVLGLAAASSSRTSPLIVLLLLFVLPAIPRAGSVWVYLRASSPVWRRVAFALAAAPIVITLASKAYTDARISSNTKARGDLTFFHAWPQRDLVEAIRRNDAAAD